MAQPEPAKGTPLWAVQKALGVIKRDLDDYDEYDRYVEGEHDDVYIPDNADVEFNMLARRSTLNLMELIVNSVTQVCFVDSIRHSTDLTMAGDDDGFDSAAELPPEMASWQHNRMDARQLPIVRTLGAHGNVYVLAVKGKDGRARYEAYTGQKAIALFEDPVNDLDPRWGFVIKRGDAMNVELGHLYNETNWWTVTQGKNGHFTITSKGKHGNTGCPLTRGALHMDLHGRAHGLVEACKVAQDQVNQTSFDILAAQSYSSFKVRYATGMAPPIRRWTKMDIDSAWPEPEVGTPEWEEWLAQDKPQIGDPILDGNGQEIPLEVKVNQKRFLMAEDDDTKFGQLDETNIVPLLQALQDRIKNLSAKAQMPPTYLMGEMANLSAEALQAAEISKTRRDGEIKMVLAEMYERMLRLGMELEGHADRADDVSTEIVWADMDPRSLAAIADAYGKFAELLGVPVTALWEDIPGMTSGKLKHWLNIRKREREQDPQLQMLGKIEEADGFSVADLDGAPLNG